MFKRLLLWVIPLLVLAVMVVCYLGLVEVGKRLFYGAAPAPVGRPALPAGHRHLRRRAFYFSTGHHGSGRDDRPQRRSAESATETAVGGVAANGP